jgi:4-hydroxythreonine-4-phosphate dehydrogenase
MIASSTGLSQSEPAQTSCDQLGEPIAVTMGDPAGIGPEIVLRLLLERQGSTGGLPALPGLGTSKFIVYGDPGILAREARRLDLDVGRLEITSCSSLPLDLPMGRVDARAGEAAYLAVRQAARDAMARKVRAIVTAPLNKEAMNAAGFRYPGHTELLAEVAGGMPVRMMLANQELRTVLVTIHQPLRQAIEALTSDLIYETIVLTHRHLKVSGVASPRIAVAGLNPHAGEGGLIGREEVEIIAPAIEAARVDGIDATGPHPPDTVFMQARRFLRFDVVVAMYHDQGLIPVKYLGLEEGVNVTVGLPFVRTSPDHGTAFDLAGKGKADLRSLAAAVHMADEMSRVAPIPSQPTSTTTRT